MKTQLQRCLLVLCVSLGVYSSQAMAKDMNCNKLGDEHARQNCRERQWDDDKQFDHKDCKKFDSKDARDRCRDYQKDGKDYRKDDKDYYKGKRETKEQYCGKKSGTRSQFDACMAQ